MARSPRPAATATAGPVPIAPAPAPAAPSTPAASVAAATSKAAAANGSAARSSRRRQSVAASAAAAAAATPQSSGNAVAGPSSEGQAPSPSARPQPPSRQPVEAKAHALRSVHGAGERVPCPFPEKYGGKEKCGVVDEDESDEVLMAACAACAAFDNRALSPDEIAQAAFQQGWLRPPSAAIEPASVISASIRSHIKRCEKAVPKRTPLLAKHQLLGAAAETALESALCPGAFEGPTRPKGPVYYLASVGKTKWRDPFEGIEVPKAPPRKPAAPRKIAKETPAASARKDASGSGSGTKEAKKVGRPRTSQASTPTPAPQVKLRLVLNPAAAAAATASAASTAPEEADTSDMGSSAGQMSRSVSQSGSIATHKEDTPMPIPIPTLQAGKKEKRRQRRRHALDSDDSSDSGSDSDMEMDGPIRPNVNVRPGRRIPPPLNLAGSNLRFGQQIRPHHPSPYLELFFDPMVAHPAESLTPTGPPVSAFPSHSLDNSTWIMRNDTDRFAAFETSSSSSDDDLRESEWGRDSGVVIRSEDDIRKEDDESANPQVSAWKEDDEEAKVKEATEALRVLFPMSSPDETDESSSNIQLNQLDNNRPAPSDTSSVAESAATVNFQTVSRGLRRSDVGPAVALNSWVSNSSPIPSPSFRASFTLPPVPDSSPTQHLSKLHGSFENDAMEVDDDDWLSESGELPVHADETLSDVDLTSTVGDVPTPERDRHLDTAEWAREAAVATSSSFQVKQEIDDDYPSPLTELEGSVRSYHTRASSIDSHTLSSGSSSDLPPFDMDGENAMPLGIDESVVAGPESVTLDEIDGWMPLAKGEKTPRGRGKGRNNVAPRCSAGPWASLGNFAVGATLCAVPAKLAQAAQAGKSPKIRPRSIRTSLRRRDSSCASRRSSKNDCAHAVAVPSPEVKPKELDTANDDIEMDAIGPADLEAARAEAETKEEQFRQACREKAEQQRAMLEALRQGVMPQSAAEKADRDPSMSINSTALSTPTTWHDLSHWPSVESLHIATPGGRLSPLALHSMSTLSLVDMPQSMDPKALLSPPVQPIAAGLAPVEISPKPQPIKPAPAPAKGKAAGAAGGTKAGKAAAGAAASAPIPIPNASTANTPQPILPAPPATAAQQAGGQPAAAPKSAPAPRKNAAIKPATLKAPSATESGDGKVSPAPSTASAASAASAPAAVPSSASVTTANSSSAPSSTAPTPTTATSTTPPAAPVEREKKSTPLCPGVVACVMDNIPVYAHAYDSKNGKACLLRRLDTDFVNGSSLLVALGVPVSRHQDYLAIPSHWLPSHHLVPPTGENGIPHLPGVPGLWIPFQAAKELAKRCRMSEKSVLSNILRDDLFSLFATIANLNTTHSPSETFGLPFVAGAALSSKNGGGRPASANNNNQANSSFAASSAANSRSTPNLSALGTSAPARSMTPGGLSMTAPGTPVAPAAAAAAAAAAAQNKGPLVRAAPAQPEGCPQPKRRRATIVGAAPVKPGPMPAVAPLTSTASAPAAAAGPPAPGQNKPPVAPPALAAAQAGPAKATPIAPAPAKLQQQAQAPAPAAPSPAIRAPAQAAQAKGTGTPPSTTPAPAKATPSTPATPAAPSPSAQKTAAARRATRASVGAGETAKPKLVK